MAKALEPWLETWNGSASRARHDYTTDQHLMQEMLDDEYFGALHYRFRVGDLVFVTDAAHNRATFIIEDIDSTYRKVRFSLLRTHYVQPITKPAADKADPGLTVRFRGPRGGQFCIVDQNDQIISGGHRTKREAEEKLSLLLLQKSEAA